MKAIFFVLAIVIMSATVTAVDVRDICQANGFSSGVSSWTCVGDVFSQESFNYISIESKVSGNCASADWKISQSIDGIVVENSRGEVMNFDGGSEGKLAAWDNTQIATIAFCNYYHSGSDDVVAPMMLTQPSGVPEYSTITLGAAVLVSLLGLVALRRQ